MRGWDDPRMPTIKGLRRRGYTAEVLNKFCEDIGVTRCGRLSAMNADGRGVFHSCLVMACLNGMGAGGGDTFSRQFSLSLSLSLSCLKNGLLLSYAPVPVCVLFHPAPPFDDRFRNDNLIEVEKLEHWARSRLNLTSRRVMGALSPIKVRVCDFSVALTLDHVS